MPAKRSSSAFLVARTSKSVTYLFGYDPPNWNEYIGKERMNKYAAAGIKRTERGFGVFFNRPEYRYDLGYPAQLTIRAHFANKRKDLDNVRYKGLLDALVHCGCIENDNLSYIQRIVLEPVFDGKTLTEIEISPLA